MTEVSFTLFDTPIGRCSIAWGANGVVGVGLPEPTDLRAEVRMRRRWPDVRRDKPPQPLADAITRIAALLGGEKSDLSDVEVDWSEVTEFDRSVYEVARTVPPGKTITYGEIAKQLGDPLAARAVGQAMGNNPYPLVVPCHRVLAAGGKLGGFSATGGVETKRRILVIEGALEPNLFDEF
ncbi:methylated-DNA--[protein]-cysteine S-methyltransferase [Labedaea rhizosphaerae]|uniref:methylated-DNA--[protein]-cysteine S-methyltransferase n=1 Tax=Labedaea rhizosphaerae TaxID=598644 RepID=A0A4R6S330_LABRH|nr:methylated-DNA--[protein]-cysteine S-methyltransferase [Labedaea rhizosphaerae]TDP93991.1 methylated-DNA-[protein]-cysteine S-methyltransferase [Labedaea rhizosphaerae]